MVVRFKPTCLTLSHNPHHTAYFSKQVTVRCSYGKHMKRGGIRRPQIVPSMSGNSEGVSVFVVSDLHIDYAENLNWVERACQLFEHVFYVPGNHDLWCHREGQNYVDSFEKLNKLLDACKRIGVETNPMVIYEIGIIPLFSWHHESFDKEKDITGFRIPSLETACKDFYACKWPEGLSNGDISLALYFDAMNDKQMEVIKDIQMTCDHIITFSHFVPSCTLHKQELCPEKRILFYPKLPKIIGSDSLEDRISNDPLVILLNGFDTIAGLKARAGVHACFVKWPTNKNVCPNNESNCQGCNVTNNTPFGVNAVPYIVLPVQPQSMDPPRRSSGNAISNPLRKA
ncbi:hypothetical protein E2542_SST31256 [Spatholobus suberectus]|nr:hypothetical protein E2542_SST31256 [Spatholobus suberectus]